MKTHVIVTYSGVHYQITAEQEEKLRDLKLDGQFKIEGNLIKARNIADVLTLEKYYETYPEKRPAYVDKYKTLPGMGYEGIIKKFSKGDALKGMIKGLKRYINSTPQNPVTTPNGFKTWYQGTDAPLELLEQMENKLKLYESGK